jgi:GNAT superfamily N-acetyltransferase
VDILTIDGSDPKLFHRAHGILEDAARSGREFPTLLPRDEALVLLTTPPPDYRFTTLVCAEGDDWLGAAWLTWSLAENQQMLAVEIAVDPAHRRRGAGSALLEAARAEARLDGRSVLLGEAFRPYDDSGAGGADRFAEHHGFTAQYAALHQVLDFPIDNQRLNDLAAGIASKHHDYDLVSWDGPCPAEHIEEFCELLSLVDEQVPLDDLDLQPKRWTPERLRAAEERRRTQGRFGSTTVVIAADGTLAGYTRLAGSAQQPGRLDQGDTLVRTEHRGHRLGLALKLANLRALQTRTTEQATIHTWNAEANAAMIAVNDDLGFRPVEHQRIWQGLA